MAELLDFTKPYVLHHRAELRPGSTKSRLLVGEWCPPGTGTVMEDFKRADNTHKERWFTCDLTNAGPDWRQRLSVSVCCVSRHGIRFALGASFLSRHRKGIEPVFVQPCPSRCSLTFSASSAHEKLAYSPLMFSPDMSHCDRHHEPVVFLTAWSITRRRNSLFVYICVLSTRRP